MLSAAIIRVNPKRQKWKHNGTSMSLIRRTSVSVCFSSPPFKWAHTNTSLCKVQPRAERATHMSMKKIYNNPGLGVSRPATSMVINLSEEKRWQIKAFECSYFLYTTRQKELMSHYAVPQITPREKNSSPQTAECGGSTPSGEVIFRLIGLCGIQWTWRHLPPTGLGFFLIGAMQTPRGNIAPQLSLTFSHLFRFRGLATNSITDGFCTSATCLLGAHACYVK